MTEALYRGLGDGAWTLAHLGQSLDGRIATADGESHYVTGPENIRHLHRMRALADAVVVGAETVRRDDPRLTVRQVAGADPLRVVLDPRRRLGAEHRVFKDRAAPTLLVTAVAGAARHGEAEVLQLAETDGALPLDALEDALQARGVRRIFVEGGGVTVSRYLIEGALDFLQITVAPLIIGAGRDGLALPAIAHLNQALRPPCRTFPMGADVLFHCDLRSVRRQGQKVPVADPGP